MKFSFLLPPLVLLAACAGTPQEPATAEAKTCDREYRTGSLMPSKECKAPVSEEERQRLNRELGNQIRPSSPTPSSKG